MQLGRDSIDRLMHELLSSQGSFQSGDLVERTGLTRQALHRHLVRAVGAGWLVREGRGRGTRYESPFSAGFDRSWALAGLEEGHVLSEYRAWLDAHALVRSEGADSILSYAIAEIVNNAIDHSGATGVRVRSRFEGEVISIDVADAGIGAFENIRLRLRLENHLHALQELSKGKTTTWPERHTGEGLFFTSKAVDRFRLTANRLVWIVDNTLPDQTVEAAAPDEGTRVELEIAAWTARTTTEVFERYTHDLEFDKTRCVIRLFEYGLSFVSRSEAKRLVANLDRFREVVLDFRGVKSVGQGFVDEVFRVWALAHREVRLVPESMNREVEFMVRRGLARADQDQRPW